MIRELLDLTERLLRSAERGGRATLLAVLGLLVASTLAQVVFGARYKPDPSHATRYAASAVMGLLHGHGLTVSDEEAMAVFHAKRHDDLLLLYAPDAERGATHEPMPGVPLLFYVVARLFGELRLATLSHLQALLHAGLALLFYLELRRSHPLAAILASVGWAFFVPQFRVTSSPGHDALASFAYLAVVAALLRYHASNTWGSLAAAGLLCGVGLWLRSYFFVLPLVLLGLLLVFKRPRVRVAAIFVVPVVVLGLGLGVVRNTAAGTTHTFVRGGVWHNFWTGVGQFDNDLGIVATDWSIRIFAQRLDPTSDFDFPNYQYSARYNEILREAALDYLPDHWPELLRNGLYRTCWLVLPALAPSAVFASNPLMRLLLLAANVPLLLLALLGLVITLRKDPFHALLLIAPLCSLVPVAGYYLVAKVPTQVFFGTLALAGLAVEERYRALRATHAAGHSSS